MKLWWKKFLNTITFGLFCCQILGHTKSKDPFDYTTDFNYYKYGFCAKCRKKVLVGWFEDDGFVPVEEDNCYKSTWRK